MAGQNSYDFKRRGFDLRNFGIFSSGVILTPEQRDRLERMRRALNFYEGYHWEEIPYTDRPEITFNFCRPFVNKFVSAEFGNLFSIRFKDTMNEVKVRDNQTVFDYLWEVWESNNVMHFLTELGQMKSLTGDAWVQVRYVSKEELASEDVFDEYPNGRIQVTVIPTMLVFPYYDSFNKDKLIKLVIQYPVDEEIATSITGTTTTLAKKLYKQEWTREKIITSTSWTGTSPTILNQKLPSVEEIPNPYGFIPFVQVKNFPEAGKSEGQGDMDDIIPLNAELNMKVSDVSEIIDYHAAPITVLFGARINSLEKGANKVWGGLPKDARVENLELHGDLAASQSYISVIRDAISEIGGVPVGALGGTQHISNTSGVALQFVNMPLIERLRIKRMMSAEGLEQINKMILFISQHDKLITKPEGVSNADFYWNEVDIADTMPKDMLIELQMILQEMTAGLEDRKSAMQRLGKEDIDEKIKLIDAENQKKMMEGLAYAQAGQVMQQQATASINSGMMNGETPIEQLRKEMTGQNKKVNVSEL